MLTVSNLAFLQQSSVRNLVTQFESAFRVNMGGEVDVYFFS